MKMISFAVPLIAAGMVFAQTVSTMPAPAKQATSQAGQHMRSDWFMRRLTANLSLTPEQQTKVRGIFEKAREETRVIAPQLRTERESVMKAIKSDSTDQITKIIDQNAQLNANAAAIHARAIAEVRATLSSSQQVKFDENLHAFMHRPMHRMGHRMEGQSQTQG